MNAEISKDNIAKRTWLYEMFDRLPFDEAFYNAVRDEMRVVARYIQFGADRSILKELREFYLEYR